MKPRRILYTPEFLKAWRRVPVSIRAKVERKEKIFRQDIYHSSLKTHQLKGKLKGYYSFSVDYHWRIVFRLVDQDIFLDVIGTHSVYK